MSQPRMKESPGVLIVRLSSFGDIVLTTPVVRCLKQQLNAQIHYVVKEQFATAIVNNPHVDQLHILKKSQPLGELIGEWKGLELDYIVDLHNNLRSRIVKWRLQTPSRSFPKLNVEKWLMVNLKINRLPDKHIVDRYFQPVTQLGVQNDGNGLDFPVGQEAHDFAQSKLKEFGVSAYLAIALGASKATRCLEIDQLAALLRLIDFPVVLLGGPEDAAVGEALEGQFDYAFNMAGKASLLQSAALVDAAKLLITPDTGLMHIGAALDKSMIVYWGNTIPAFGMAPYYRQGSAARLLMREVSGLGCRPCSKIGYDRCPKRHFKCIRNLDIAEIAAVADKWMQEEIHA